MANAINESLVEINQGIHLLNNESIASLQNSIPSERPSFLLPREEDISSHTISEQKTSQGIASLQNSIPSERPSFLVQEPSNELNTQKTNHDNVKQENDYKVQAEGSSKVNIANKTKQEAEQELSSQELIDKPKPKNGIGAIIGRPFLSMMGIKNDKQNKNYVNDEDINKTQSNEIKISDLDLGKVQAAAKGAKEIGAKETTPVGDDRVVLSNAYSADNFQNKETGRDL